MKKQLSIFGSKGFIIALAILLLNDHYLKASIHNDFTGKLSDFAGLFIFPLFFTAFLPSLKKHIYGVVAILFIWWKSPLSNSFIEWYNQLPFFSIHRVIDWTDLFALLILPLSFHYFNTYKNQIVKFNPLPIIMVSLFSFIATSQAREEIKLNNTYFFSYSLDSLKMRIFLHPNIYNGLRKDWLIRDSLEHANPLYLHIDSLNKKNDLFNRYISNNMTIEVMDTTCNSRFRAEIEINGDQTKSGMFVGGIYHYCHDKKEVLKPLVQKIFENKIIRPLEK